MRICYYFILMVILLTGCSYENENPDMKLSGDIIMSTPNLKYASSDYFLGLVKLNAENREAKLIFNERTCIEPCYNEDKSKVLFIWNWKFIYEYDCNKRTLKMILDTQDKTKGFVDVTVEFAEYIPKSNCICYFNDDKMFIFNPEKNIVEKEIDDVRSTEGCSWSNDGKSFIYNKSSDRSKVFKYNLEDDTSEFLFYGIYPIYSSDNNYIAYYKDTPNGNIFVRNMKTFEEKKSVYAGDNFKFSPDSTKLAYIVSSGIAIWDLIVWDFETGEHCVLMEEIAKRADFDWK